MMTYSTGSPVATEQQILTQEALHHFGDPCGHDAVVAVDDAWGVVGGGPGLPVDPMAAYKVPQGARGVGVWLMSHGHHLLDVLRGCGQVRLPRALLKSEG
jgi:hypothetical protein